MNTPIWIYYLGCVCSYATSRWRWLKREAGLELLEEIVAGLRRSHSEPPPRKKCFTTVLSKSRRRGVLRLSRRNPRLRAADHPFFGRVGGRNHERFEVSELEVARGENKVWVMNGDWDLGPSAVAWPFRRTVGLFYLIFQSHAIRFLLYVYCRVGLIRWRVTAVIVLRQSSGARVLGRAAEWGMG